MNALIKSSQFTANHLSHLRRLRYLPLKSVYPQTRQLMLVSGGLTIKLIGRFFSSKRRFFRINILSLMMAVVTRRKLSEPKCVATLEGHSCYVHSVAFHPTAPLLATGSCDNTAKLWRISADGSAATRVATLEGHNNCVWSVAFHPTAPLLATGSGDKTAKLWR